MCITLDIALPAVHIIRDISSSANVYYLRYCLVCQRILSGLLPRLPMCITLDMALSANVCYLG
jgi:hypothetical protein